MQFTTILAAAAIAASTVLAAPLAPGPVVPSHRPLPSAVIPPEMGPVSEPSVVPHHIVGLPNCEILDGVMDGVLCDGHHGHPPHHASSTLAESETATTTMATRAMVTDHPAVISVEMQGHTRGPPCDLPSDLLCEGHHGHPPHHHASSTLAESSTAVTLAPRLIVSDFPEGVPNPAKESVMSEYYRTATAGKPEATIMPRKWHTWTAVGGMVVITGPATRVPP